MMKGNIEALFGSKTRVKLLQLFMSNPEDAYYVREITRLIDEQINSVRRELANMLKIGVITSESRENKLYYQANQRFENYVALRAMFAGAGSEALAAGAKSLDDKDKDPAWHEKARRLPGARFVVLSGVFTGNSSSNVDLLVAGDVKSKQLEKLIEEIETFEGRSINYTSLSFEDFYYRVRVRDRFTSAILTGEYRALLDKDKVINEL